MTKQQSKISYYQQASDSEILKKQLNKQKRGQSGKAYIKAQNELEKSLCSSLQRV